MNWAQVVLPLILGLVVISWQRVHAEEAFTFKGKNSTKPGNRTGFEAFPDDHDFYVTFACRGKTNGLHLPIAGSCVEYYECQDGLAKRLTCKNGMHFSSLALTCLDARLSTCKQEEPASNCEGQCCGREDGLYPAKGKCSEFLVCVNGVTLERNCGGNLQFSAANKVCDIPERAMCSEVATAERDDVLGSFVKPIMYTISHRVCRNQANGSTISILGSCNKFYLCIDNVGYLKSCGHLQFNPQIRFCDARTRMYCPLIEQDDVILDEDEYVAVDFPKFPVPRPRPIPFNSIEDKFEIEPPHVEVLGKRRPRPESFENEEEVHRRRPRPPLVEEQMLQSGKKPAPANQETGNRRRPRPSFMGEQADSKKQTVPRPPVPVDFDFKYEQQKSIGEKKPIASSPFTPKESPQVVTPDKEDKLAAAYLNICANQPVGALMAMSDNCSKFIRCRWDWFERRVAEVVNCPSEMHFNAKSKKCDWPANAGCIAFSSDTLTVNKKKNKYTGAF